MGAGPVTVSNNVVGLSTSAANCLLCVEDYSGKESAEAMKIKANGNLYNRNSTSAPTWLAVWSRGAGNPYVFTTLAAMKSTTGQEARGQEVTGQAVVTAAGALSDVGTRSAAVALPLPSDVASAIGRASGSVQLGIWSASSVARPTPTPTPTPTPRRPTTLDAADDRHLGQGQLRSVGERWLGGGRDRRLLVGAGRALHSSRWSAGRAA